MKLVLATPTAAAAAFLIGWGLNWLAMLNWERRQNEHWTKKARRLFPLRASALINPLVLAAVAAVTVQSWKGDFAMHGLPPTLAAWLGASLSGYLSARRIWPRLTFGQWCNDCTLRLIFFLGGLLLMGLCLMLMPARFGWQTWAITAFYLVAMLSLLLGLGLRLVRWFGFVEPAPPGVESMARFAAEQAGAKLGRVWTSQGYVAQAYALLPMRDMLLTKGLLKALSDEELMTVCAHEAAHLTESRWVFAGRVMGALTLFPLIFLTPAMSNFGLAGLLALSAATFLTLSLTQRLSRRMENRADAAAADSMANPEIYARALEKIYAANLIPATMPRKRQSHPDLYDRMLAAGVTPSYERPRPPRGLSWTTFLLLVALAFLIVRVAIKEEQARFLRDDTSESEPTQLMTLEVGAVAATNSPPENE